MNWRCKLGHPFEWGLYTTTEKRTRTFMDESEEYDFWLLKCHYCNYVYDSSVTGKPNLDFLHRPHN